MRAAEILRKHIVNYERKIIELEGKRQMSNSDTNREEYRLNIEFVEMQIQDHKDAIAELEEMNSYVS